MGLREIKRLLSFPSTLKYRKWDGVVPSARGIPVPILKEGRSCDGCRECAAICPTKTITIGNDESLHFDYGACLQCGICVEGCPEKILVNSNFVGVFALSRETLKV